MTHEPLAPTTTPRVVIVGAGFGGLAAAKKLGGQPIAVTVVDRLNYHLFQPLLYQVALAGLAATDIAYPIRAALHGHHNIDVVLAEVVGFDLERRLVRLSDGSDLPYEYLVVAAGARTSYFGHDDWARIAPGIKDLDDALEVRRRVLIALEAAERTTDPEERRQLTTFVVVGGGPTGVELAGAIADLSRDILRPDFHHVRPEDVRVVLIEASDRILTAFDPRLSERAVEQLRELGVDVRTGVRVDRIDERGVAVRGAQVEEIRAATVLWGAGVRTSPLAEKLGARVDRGGRVMVEPDCSLPGHPRYSSSATWRPWCRRARRPPCPASARSPFRRDDTSRGSSARREPARSAGPPFSYLDKGFMATIGRARAVAQIRKLRIWGFLAWLTWAFVHLWYLVGFRNRLFVFINWVWAYVWSQHGARIITGRSPLRTPAPLPGAADVRRTNGQGESTATPTMRP